MCVFFFGLFNVKYLFFIESKLNWIYLIGLDNKGNNIILQVDSVERVQKLKIPEELKINNYMGTCYINERAIFLLGGLNYERDNISNKAYVYNAENSTST